MSQAAQTVDVLIVGAGLSGVGAACQLRQECPDQSVVVLEARDAIGGTWDLFRYPGIRSDSDMFTLGYRFSPWTDSKAIADGPSILRYIHDTAQAFEVDELIRRNHRVVNANWDSDEARWTVEVHRTDTDERITISCSFLYVCTGYYRYDEGFSPKFPGVEHFQGPVIHPQHWPEDLDYRGKRVVVIGSGATAVTLVPTLAESAAHVTMLQRSPSYVISMPNEDRIARRLRRVLPQRLAHLAVRWKNILLMMGHYRLSRRAPKLMRRLMRAGVKKALPAGYDVDTHFSPRYDPWDQRVCLVPDGDLFEAIGSGHASVVTDRIKTFTETGIELESGERLEADIVITATGLNLLVLGGMQIEVDGREVDLSRTLTYRGMMLGGVPNMAMATGYTNASWTLKADLICQYVTRLLNHMDARGYTQATPRPPADPGETEPFLNLTSGYVLRSLDRFPRQGAESPWRVHQNYLRDLALIRRADLEEGMQFTAGSVAKAPAERVAA
jgi:monooxygenase